MMPASALEAQGLVEPQAKRQTWMAAIDLGLGWSPLRFWTPGQTPTHARSRSPVSRELSAELAPRPFEPDACHR